MNQEFKTLLRMLYEEFGDQATDWMKDQVDTRLNDPPSSGSAQAAGGASSAGKPDPQPSGEAHGSGSSAPEQNTRDEGDDEVPGPVQVEMARLVGAAILTPEGVVEAVREMILMAGEVRKYEEAQVTARVSIAAERDVALARIQAQKDNLERYLSRSFDERAENFDRLFGVVDNALETNNMEALALGLESVIHLAASSPFKDLRSVKQTAAALTDPSHEWDF